jgi:predicted transcriptional regulator
MDIHKALSSDTRKNIIQTLSTGPKYLSQLSEAVGRKPQTLDFHMKLLSAADLVRSEWRSGKKYYILKRAQKPKTEVRSLHPELLVKLDSIESKLDRLLRKRKLEHLY